MGNYATWGRELRPDGCELRPDGCERHLQFNRRACVPETPAYRKHLRTGGAGTVFEEALEDIRGWKNLLNSHAFKRGDHQLRAGVRRAGTFGMIFC